MKSEKSKKEPVRKKQKPREVLIREHTTVLPMISEDEELVAELLDSVFSFKEQDTQ